MWPEAGRSLLGDARGILALADDAHRRLARAAALSTETPESEPVATPPQELADVTFTHGRRPLGSATTTRHDAAAL